MAFASADFGGVPVMVVDRLRYVAGERVFSNTPFAADAQVRLAVVAEHRDRARARRW